MRIFLALILLVNSYVAIGASTNLNEFADIEALIQHEPASSCGDKNGRTPASADCDTPKELMAANVNTTQFTRICKNIVANDEGCKKLKPEKRMSCSAKRNNEILSSADLLSKAGQCAKGFLWDSMVDLGKFILEIIKTLVKAQVNSVTGMIKFLSDSEYRQKTIASVQSGSKLGMAFLNSAGLYFTREFSRNLAKNPLNPLAAIGQTLLVPLMKFITESVQAIAAHFIPQYQCMNGTAKLYTICRVLGDFIMPPAFVFAFMKYGVRGLQALSRTQAGKIARVRGRFAEANEARRVVQQTRRTPAPAPSRITVDQTRRPQARRTPAPAPTPVRETARVVHPRRPAAPQPLLKPIEEHSADELIEVARSERIDPEVLATADLNRAEAARIESLNPDVAARLDDVDEYKGVLQGLAGSEKAEATHAIGQLSKSGASPAIVVDMFRKYAPQFRAEVARTPAGSEDLWVKLGRVIGKEKAAGKSDQAIKQKIDDAFKCE
jgi:hypothetical protein